jgi:hypothetical protein
MARTAGWVGSEIVMDAYPLSCGRERNCELTPPMPALGRFLRSRHADTSAASGGPTETDWRSRTGLRLAGQATIALHAKLP